MKAFKFFALAGIVSLVARELASPSPEFHLLNASSLDAVDKDLQLSNFTNASASDTNQLVHTLAISKAEWDDVACRGKKFFFAMTRGSAQGTRYINSLTTSWDGNVEDDMLDWAWDGWNSEDYWCDFEDDGLGTALKALDISLNVGGEGDNKCFSAWHYDSPTVIPDEEDYMPAKADQHYHPLEDPSKEKKRCTGAHYTFGVNAPSGVFYFVSRENPVEAARKLWGRAPLAPDLRASSDLAWGLWNKQGGPSQLGDIRKMFSLYITNTKTQELILKAIAKQGVTNVKTWPGTDIDARSEEGLAIIGSANGRVAGYFLAQHKASIGRDKYVSKITVFRTDRKSEGRMIIFFWIDDVPSPPPEMADPDDDQMNTGPGRMDPRLVKRSGDGKSIVREYVVWA